MASREILSNDAAYWYVPIARAVPAALLAVLITFSGDHSPQLGFLTFGAFAVLSGLIVGVLSIRALSGRIERGIFVASGVVTLAAGVVALLSAKASLPFLLVLLSGWAAVSGFLELYAGLRTRRRHPASRDWIFTGALTALFAVVVLLVPPEYSQQFTGPDGVTRVLNASVIVVGALSAYGAIVTVYLAIAGLSLRWAPRPEEPGPAGAAGRAAQADRGGTAGRTAETEQTEQNGTVA